MPKRRALKIQAASLAAATAFIITGVWQSAPASAEVRFGKNVRIGGHDVSGQTYNQNRRGRFYIYNRKPKRAGCRWVRNRDGSRTRVCHFRRKN